MKLPKNFRQIGEAAGTTKIYIEDYVMTYLDYITKDSGTYVRGAILFGTIEKEKNDTYVFVKGAMEAQNIELDLDETVFDHEVWKRIYQVKEQYFHHTQVIGWYLCRMGMSIRLNDKIKRTHFENFPGEGKILYIKDPLEENDAMYAFRGQDLVRQTGYYIYYVKNHEMQEYLIHKKNEKKDIQYTYEQMVVKKRDQQIIQQSRQRMKRKKAQKKRSAVRQMAAAAILMFCFGSAGTYAFFGGHIETKEAAALITDQVNRLRNPQEEKTVISTDFQEEVTEETIKQEAVYVVQSGDTLTKISVAQLGSKEYVDEIMKANGISVGETIYPGQELKIPVLK